MQDAVQVVPQATIHAPQPADGVPTQPTPAPVPIIASVVPVSKGILHDHAVVVLFVLIGQDLPTLRNPNYYTKSSMDKLKTMSSEELARVDDFTVGCEELGFVCWHGKTYPI